MALFAHGKQKPAILHTFDVGKSSIPVSIIEVSDGNLGFRMLTLILKCFSHHLFGMNGAVNELFMSTVIGPYRCNYAINHVLHKIFNLDLPMVMAWCHRCSIASR